MAKIKKEKVLDAKLRIATCERCKGKPTPSPFKAPPFEGERCADCWEILDYRAFREYRKC